MLINDLNRSGLPKEAMKSSEESGATLRHFISDSDFLLGSGLNPLNEP